jgi:phenylalanine ammonia-lyase
MDLRAMYAGFFSLLEERMEDILSTTFRPPLSLTHTKKLSPLLVARAQARFHETSSLDTDERFQAVCRPLVADVFEFLSHGSGQNLLGEHTFDVSDFVQGLASSLADAWILNRKSYFENGTAENLMGMGTRLLYTWVRHKLGVPMRCGVDLDEEETDMHVSRIYEGVVRGDVNTVLIKMFDQTRD